MNKLLLLDTSAIIYKSHFAMPKLKTSDGFFTGAILGFVTQLELYIKKIEPTHIAAAFDVKRSTLKRTEIFPDYKKKRSEMPIELRNQIEVIEDILKAYRINNFSADRYEADDVIASLCEFAKKYDIKVHILTGDKDLEQLVDDSENITIHLLGKDIEIKNRADVKNHLKIYPEQIPDFFGLKGDSSDGIPGVFGIGDSNGIPLIDEFSTLENIYNNLDKIKASVRAKLEKDKESAFLCRELAYVNKKLDFGIELDDLIIKNKNVSTLKEIYNRYELKKLYSSIDEASEQLEISYTVISFSELISKMKNAKNISFYVDEDYIGATFDKKTYLVKIENTNTLFSTEVIDFSKIETNANFVLYDAKKYMHLGLPIKDNFFDILIASYILNTEGKLELDNIFSSYLNLDIPIIDKKELKKLTDDQINEIQKLKAATIAYGLSNLENILKEKLVKIDTENTYEKIEKPLINVLYSMEKNGIKIDKDKFNDFEKELIEIVKIKENKVYELAEKKFNIDSPKQLGNVLYEMGVPLVKKSKTGFSTNVDVLEDLSNLGYEIATVMLEYRFYKKLLSTYIEPIPKFADENSRVHSIFNGTGTATGRLSSNNPNLQNIPTRTLEGTKIRNCFVSDKDNVLVSFDYSQIELRVLAQLSKDEHLIDAYKNDLDLHELTARKIFAKFNNEPITKFERNIAKTINFSVLYGKTPYGLSKELKIPIDSAKRYIDTYFQGYPKVAPFLDNIVNEALKNGYVKTLFGTRRYIHDIRSSNKLIFEQGKRMAINTVVQGTAANIIKMVMIKLHKLGYKLLIQVHDELIFELPKNEAERLSKEIKKIMEETIHFDLVKLKVNCSIGDNWGELK
ncbi:DNA polymerase I [Caviibacter abscessus]|uniref:DNA polymerase I n=1 Tax=Caviibacter abscessus TaxID=1766719 RepID=UPI000829C67E|nr:DNA polymerase I [Caviibacter abscessus]